MSDDRYRDRNPFSEEEREDRRARSDNWVGEGRMAGFGRLAYDTPYRGERPSDDFSNRNARRDYDPYAAGDRYERHGSSGYRRDDHERGFFDRASDQVASWLGDDDAQARRDEDHRGKGPRGYVRSDARILDDVSDRLADDRWVDASDIEVKVTDAEVTLTGTVRSREQKRRAEDCAEMVSGVQHVQNNLRVARRDTEVL
ncbi:BON domain-containing protein [Falsirhodobacter deserti]|uniref:BON domain-containing protein n=1 Tax=Falsirhodobacter deserti TaxID=1365611 RepID=UPI000FE2A5C3|nr:BON domain-containing protein [Falsirhodobacter deserti]